MNQNKWNNISQSLDSWKSVLTEQKGAREQLQKVKATEEVKLEEVQEIQRLSHLAHLFLLSEIVERRQQAIESIQEIGTRALRMIYGDDYKLRFDTFEEKRKEGIPNFKMEINIVSLQEGLEVTTGIDDERGGGLVEIIAFALRIAALKWLNYGGPLILDEAYKSMSNDEKIESVAIFLKEFSGATGRQIIFATHMAGIFAPVAQNIIKIEKIKGIARHTKIDKDSLEFEYS